MRIAFKARISKKQTTHLSILTSEDDDDDDVICLDDAMDALRHCTHTKISIVMQL